MVRGPLLTIDRRYLYVHRKKPFYRSFEEFKKIHCYEFYGENTFYCSSINNILLSSVGIICISSIYPFREISLLEMHAKMSPSKLSAKFFYKKSIFNGTSLNALFSQRIHLFGNISNTFKTIIKYGRTNNNCNKQPKKETIKH